MTWKAFYFKLIATIMNPETRFGFKLNIAETKIKVRFDFPLFGNAETYEVVSIDEAGIVLRNPHCARPVGHE